MAAKRAKKEPDLAIVDFRLDERTYQIDPKRRKVYRRFVEIETSKACEIFAQWRAREVSA